VATLKDIEAEVKELKDTVNRWRQRVWVVSTVTAIVGGVFGISLAATWNSIVAARADAQAARELAAKAVSELSEAKNGATEEIRVKGQTLLVDYQGRFEGWVKQRQEDFLPKNSILPWIGRESRAPFGWRLCNGDSGYPNLDTAILLGTNNPEILGVDQNQTEEPTRVSETERLTGQKVSNITASFYRVRYLCRI
jgi:hypothetical protein